MYHCFAMTSFISVVPEISIHENVQPAENQVRYPEIDPEESHRDGHNNGCRPHTQARRPIHLPHLHTHVVQETSRVLPVLANLPHRLHQRKSAYPVFLLFPICLRRTRHIAT